MSRLLKDQQFRRGYKKELEKLRSLSRSIPIAVRKVQRTCRWCPSQWEGMTVDGRPIYARYRHGHLSVRIGRRGRSINDAVSNGRRIVDVVIGDDLDGVLTYAELKRHTRRLILWPPRATERSIL